MKVIRLLTMILALMDTPISAQTLKKGVQLYQSGQFDNAAKALNSALPKVKAAKERAEVYKYLGLNQFMLGKQREAEMSFARAKQNDPMIRLRDDEVLDPRALELFNKVGDAPVGTAKAKIEKTTLLINSNVRGTVLVDGIIVGQTNTPLEMNPGSIRASVEAPGYLTFNLQTTLKPNQSHNLSITLKRNEKPKSAAKVAATSSSAIKSKAKGGAAQSKKKNDSLFADEPPMPEFKENAAPRSSAHSQQMRQVPLQGSATQTPQQSMTQSSVPGYQLPPQLMQQPQPYGGSPVVVQPQIYIQPYTQQQPYYGQGYAMPQQQMPYQTPYQYNQPSGLQPPAPPPAYSAPHQSYHYNEPPPSARPKVAKKRSEKSSNSVPGIVKILPFGIPQFVGESYLKGSFFLISQGVGIYFWKANNDAAEAEKKAVEEKVAEIDAQLASTSDQTEINALNTTREQRIQEGKTFIDKATQNANLSLGIFVGSYVLNVIDAFVFADEPAKTSEKKTKPRRFRASLLPTNGGHFVSSYKISPEDWGYHLTLNGSSRIDGEPKSQKVFLALNLEL